MFAAAAWRALLNMASPGGPRRPLSILIYHRVLPAPDPIAHDEVDAAMFDWQMRLLKGSFRILPLDEAIGRLQQGTLPRRALAITFDDGYADNVTIALPILQRHGLQATFFIATGFLDGGRMWNDSIIETFRAARGDVLDLDRLGLGRHPIGTMGQRRTAIDAVIAKVKYRPIGARLEMVEAIREAAAVSLPDDLMMSTDQVYTLHRAGMTIGGHTCGHPILASVPDHEARVEIVEGRRTLADIVGEPISLFAYPNGRPGTDYDARHVRIVREAGFTAAVTTSWGAARRDGDRFQLPRFTPWDRSAARFLLRLAHNARRDGTILPAAGTDARATTPQRKALL
jgi:peptidoglycan/xylan/chitin deacetylase (PgdA/CDA1 family)